MGKIPTGVWEQLGQSRGADFGSVGGVARHDADKPDRRQRDAEEPSETGQPVESGAEDEHRDAPVGAIALTTFLAITILVFWFGMYFLNIARSS